LLYLHFTHYHGFLFVNAQVFKQHTFLFPPITVFPLHCGFFSFCFWFLFVFVIIVATLSEHMAKWLKRQGALQVDEHQEMDGLTPPVPSPVTVAVRPNQLPIVNPLRPAESQPVTSSPTCGVADGATTDAHDGIGKLLAALNGVSPG
jgi:hypothetical protein